METRFLQAVEDLTFITLCSEEAVHSGLCLYAVSSLVGVVTGRVVSEVIGVIVYFSKSNYFTM